MTTTKNRLAGGASRLPAIYAPTWGAPGLMRGPTIPRQADDGAGAGAGDDDARPDEALEKLKANNAKLLKEAADARKAKADLEAWKAAREADDALAQEEADKKAGEFAKVEAKLKGEADDYRAKYEKLVGDRALKDALIEAKIDDTYKPAVEALLREKGIKLTKDGEAQINSQPVAEFVKEWAASDAGKPFILNGNSGGGANGGGGGGGNAEPNPWKTETRNLTKQGEILRSDPTKAERLKREAGVS